MKTPIGILSLVLALALLLTGCGSPEPVELTPQQKAEAQLDAHHIPDAQYKGILYHEVLNRDFMSFVSEENGLTYHFNPETGAIFWIEDTDGVYPEESGPFNTEETIDTVLGAVLPWVQEQQIGEFTIDRDREMSCTLTEYYDGIPTGTRISVSFSPQGCIRYCSIRYGSVFTKTPDGDVVPVDPRPMIGEEAAIAIAEAAAAEAVKESGFPQTMLPEQTTCDLQAWENDIYYHVNVYFLLDGFNGETNCCIVNVNPYDGSLELVSSSY